jgi:methionyl-tRNA formyltransferase
MEAGLDTGPMLLSRAISIDPQDSTGSLHDRLARLGGELVVEALARLDELVPVVQPEAGVTYASKILKAEAQLDWNQAADVLARKVRAFDPFPGAVVTLAGEPVKAWRGTTEAGSGRPGQVLAADSSGIVVACGEGVLRLTELQKPGSRRVGVADFLNGSSLRPD